VVQYLLNFAGLFRVSDGLLGCTSGAVNVKREYRPLAVTSNSPDQLRGVFSRRVEHYSVVTDHKLYLHAGCKVRLKHADASAISSYACDEPIHVGFFLRDPIPFSVIDSKGEVIYGMLCLPVRISKELINKRNDRLSVKLVEDRPLQARDPMVDTVKGSTAVHNGMVDGERP